MNWFRFIGILGIMLGQAVGFAQEASPTPAPEPTYSINLYDGRVIKAIAVRRDGNNVMATQALSSAPGAAAVMGQVGYSIKSIKNVEFPEPPELDAAVKLLAVGKPVEAIAKISPALTFAESFTGIPGNRWEQLAIIQLNALTQSKRENEAETLAARLMKSASNPEAIFTARLQIAANWVRKADYARAIAVFDEVIQKSQSSENLAAAWLNKGHALLGGNNPEPALLAYLRVSVLYPNQALLVPGALLGAARAYTAMGDSVNAAQAKQDLLTLYPDSPEATSIKAQGTKP